MLKRQTLPDIIAFASPLGALVGQVRRTGATVNEYGVDVGLPRSGVHRLVDVFGGAHARQAEPDRADAAAALDGADDRAPAHPPRRRALGVGHGRRAGARDQESAVGHPRRRPTAGARPQGRGPRADAADLRRDRSHPQPGRPHGGVRRRAPARHRARQHPFRARPREAAGRDPALPTARTIQRRLRSLAAAGGRQPRQADPGLPQPRQERRRGHRRGPRAGPHRAAHRLPAGRAPGRARHRRARQPAADDRGGGYGARRARSAQAAPVRPVRDHKAQGHRPRSRTGRQDHRRPRRRHRVRVGARSAPCFACCCRCRTSSGARESQKDR